MICLQVCMLYDLSRQILMFALMNGILMFIEYYEIDMLRNSARDLVITMIETCDRNVFNKALIKCQSKRLCFDLECNKT